MRWTLCVTPLAAVLIFLAGAYSGAQDKKPTKWNYYPIDVGNTWVFKVNGKDKKITSQIADDEKKDGVTIARLASPEVSSSEHLAQTDKGVFRYRLDGADVTPPFKLLPYPPIVGAQWAGKFTVASEKGEFTYQGKILGVEDVKVPFGDYKKALKVQIKLKAGDQDVETVYWFVNNIGFVKETFTVDDKTILLELESFKKK